MFQKRALLQPRIFSLRQLQMSLANSQQTPTLQILLTASHHFWHFTCRQWCIVKNGGGYTQRAVEKGLKVPCLFMITQVSICCQKNLEVAIRRIPPNTPLLADSFASFFTGKISKLRLSLTSHPATSSPHSPFPPATPPNFSPCLRIRSLQDPVQLSKQAI